MSLDSEQQRQSGRFLTTQWTLVLASRGEGSEAKEALSELCAAYYSPVVKFLRCSGHQEGARELAHEFFATLLARGSFKHFEPGRARFRSYLLGAVKHFLADWSGREAALKRGAQHSHVPFDEGTDTSPGIDPPDKNALTPEAEFDRQWALTVLERALETLAAEYRSNNRQQTYEVLKPCLAGEGPCQAEAAARLGMSEGAVKVAVHRLRRHFRDLVKAEIARTLSDPTVVDQEWSALVSALR